MRGEWQREKGTRTKKEKWKSREIIVTNKVSHFENKKKIYCLLSTSSAALKLPPLWLSTADYQTANAVSNCQCSLFKRLAVAILLHFRSSVGFFYFVDFSLASSTVAKDKERPSGGDTLVYMKSARESYPSQHL